MKNFLILILAIMPFALISQALDCDKATQKHDPFENRYTVSLLNEHTGNGVTVTTDENGRNLYEALLMTMEHSYSVVYEKDLQFLFVDGTILPGSINIKPAHVVGDEYMIVHSNTPGVNKELESKLATDPLKAIKMGGRIHYFKEKDAEQIQDYWSCLTGN